MSETLTRRHILGLTAAAGAALGLSGCGFQAGEAPKAAATNKAKAKIDGDLVYFNWAEYVDPSVFKSFSKKYDVKIVKANYDSMESMAAKLQAGNRYDIIFPSAEWVRKLTAANQLLEIDHRQIPNASRIFDHYPMFADPWYDAKSAHSIPFTMYKTGIAWRKDKLGETLSGSWNDLWNTDAQGKTFLLDDRDEVLGMAALLLGYPLNTDDPGQLDKIVARVKSLRPKLRGFSSTDYRNLLNGNAWLQHTWSGDMAAVLGVAKDPSVYGFEAPREGTPVNTDAYAIPANAQHPGTALLFIDHMLRPENVVKNMNYIGYPMPVHGTEKEYDKIAARLPACKVTSDDLKANLHFVNRTVEQTRARDAAWTKIKAG